MQDEKRFPIQGERADSEDGHKRREAGWVPWGVAAIAYEAYAKKFGTGQSLERLAERGGFGWTELVNLLRGDYFGPAVPWAEPKSQ